MKIYIEGELFQGDRNRLIFIDQAPDEEEITYVEFYNKKSKIGKEVRVYQNEAKIPNELIEEGLPIIAVACTGRLGRTSPICREVFDVLKQGSFFDEDDDDELFDSEDGEDLIIYDGGEEED